MLIYYKILCMSLDKNILRNPKYINEAIIHLMKVQKTLLFKEINFISLSYDENVVINNKYLILSTIVYIHHTKL